MSNIVDPSRSSARWSAARPWLRAYSRRDGADEAIYRSKCIMAEDEKREPEAKQAAWLAEQGRARGQLSGDCFLTIGSLE